MCKIIQTAKGPAFEADNCAKFSALIETAERQLADMNLRHDKLSKEISEYSGDSRDYGFGLIHAERINVEFTRMSLRGILTVRDCLRGVPSDLAVETCQQKLDEAADTLTEADERRQERADLTKA